jgi:hypothetical protein
LQNLLFFFYKDDIIVENGEIKSGILDKIIDYIIEMQETEYKVSEKLFL